MHSAVVPKVFVAVVPISISVGFLVPKTCLSDMRLKLASTEKNIIYLVAQNNRISSVSYRTDTFTRLCILNHISCCCASTQKLCIRLSYKMRS